MKIGSRDNPGSECSGPSTPYDICVLGLGYIGLPTASVFATKGKKVLGVDVLPHVVETINNGRIHIEEPDLAIEEAREGYARIRMALRPDMLNGHGIAHGGIVFALADTAFACACNSHGPVTVAAGAGGLDCLARVAPFEGLTVEFARSVGATVILRGLRAVSDFEFEFQMALMNKHLASEIEILFMAPDAEYSFLSSSLVREVARLGGNVDAFVAPAVARRLAERFGEAR